MFNWLRKRRIFDPSEPDRESFGDDDVDPFNPFPEPITLEISDVIDLHTIPARDVKRVVEEYLELANQKRFPVVRIIHGKGLGVQRDMVRSVLERSPSVAEWGNAPPEAGGQGATIVTMVKH